MKKNTLIITAIVMIVGLGFLGIKAKEYYDDRYVGTDYYAQLPADQDMTVEDIIDDNGKKQAEGRTYYVTAFNEDGEQRTLDFIVIGEENLLKPNTFLKLNASKQIVVQTTIINESEVPESVLKLIQNNRK